jgi:hypothetical protein
MIRWFNNIYRTLFFDPLAGGNGKVQMDEIAKAVMIIMICMASAREGKSTEQVYPDIYWIMIFASYAAIAAIKPAFSKYIHKPETKEKDVI